MGFFDHPKARAPIVPLLTIACCISGVPVASALARSGGIVERRLIPLLSFASSDVQKVAAVAAFYSFLVYVVTAGLSLAGQSTGSAQGYKNSEPRVAKIHLRGLPHRFTALHQASMEVYPSFALCTAITLALLPSESGSRAVFDKSLNYLTLHAFVRAFAYIPAYVADTDTVRSLSHFLSTGSLLGLMWGVVRG